jgi:hypothetical protein
VRAHGSLFFDSIFSRAYHLSSTLSAVVHAIRFSSPGLLIVGFLRRSSLATYAKAPVTLRALEPRVTGQNEESFFRCVS